MARYRTGKCGVGEWGSLVGDVVASWGMWWLDGGCGLWRLSGKYLLRVAYTGMWLLIVGDIV